MVLSSHSPPSPPGSPPDEGYRGWSFALSSQNYILSFGAAPVTVHCTRQEEDTKRPIAPEGVVARYFTGAEPTEGAYVYWRVGTRVEAAGDRTTGTERDTAQSSRLSRSLWLKDARNEQ